MFPSFLNIPGIDLPGAFIFQIYISQVYIYLDQVLVATQQRDGIYGQQSLVICNNGSYTQRNCLATQVWKVISIFKELFSFGKFYPYDFLLYLIFELPNNIFINSWEVFIFLHSKEVK